MIEHNGKSKKRLKLKYQKLLNNIQSKIDKKFIYLLFINVILIISLCLYSLEKLTINIEIPIYLLSILSFPKT